MIHQVLRYRDLLYMMIWRDIRVKYKQSVLGVMWAVLMPATIVLAGLVVKFAMSKVSGKPMAVAGSGERVGQGSPLGLFRRLTPIRHELPGRQPQPRHEDLLSEGDLSPQRDALAVRRLSDRLLRAGDHPRRTWRVTELNLLWLPVLVAILVILAAGMAIFLSAASLFFRDVKYLVEMILTFAIFFTPVFFDASLFGEWKNLLLLNPVAPILEGISSIVVGRGGFRSGLAVV